MVSKCFPSSPFSIKQKKSQKWNFPHIKILVTLEVFYLEYPFLSLHFLMTSLNNYTKSQENNMCFFIQIISVFLTEYNLKLQFKVKYACGDLYHNFIKCWFFELPQPQYAWFFGQVGVPIFLKKTSHFLYNFWKCLRKYS